MTYWQQQQQQQQGQQQQQQYPPYPYAPVERKATLAPERISAAAHGVHELDEAYKRFRALERELLVGQCRLTPG